MSKRLSFLLLLLLATTGCPDSSIRQDAEARRDSAQAARIDSAIRRDSAEFGPLLARQMAYLSELYGEPVVAEVHPPRREIRVHPNRWRTLYAHEKERIARMAVHALGDGPILIVDRETGEMIRQM